MGKLRHNAGKLVLKSGELACECCDEQPPCCDTFAREVMHIAAGATARARVTSATLVEKYVAGFAGDCGGTITLTYGAGSESVVDGDDYTSFGGCWAGGMFIQGQSQTSCVEDLSGFCDPPSCGDGTGLSRRSFTFRGMEPVYTGNCITGLSAAVNEYVIFETVPYAESGTATISVSNSSVDMDVNIQWSGYTKCNKAGC